MPLRPDMCYCDLLGWVNRNAIVPRTYPPKLGERVVICPLKTITRELWGHEGTVSELNDTRFFIRFATPVKSVGASMSGIWLKLSEVF